MQRFKFLEVFMLLALAVEPSLSAYTKNPEQRVVQPLTGRRPLGRRSMPDFLSNRLITLSTGSYLLSNQTVTWFEAMDICERLGMQLVTPDTPEKDADVVTVIKRSGMNSYVWISGTDLGIEDTFYWATTGALIGPFTNYGPRLKPDNYFNVEHCLHHFWDNLYWNDYACYARKRFICEVISDPTITLEV
ncbi:C-type lectin 37Da-like [Neocloeon triangulifer]|uniref:C-type lectin 37Da-like n=1 Tax=Neocloeon triangulifer TaxID=2078957 RepID=UPI00286F94F0|nr:C-type lectin 37Da-like [Neocloeon triangulifer]